VRIEGRGRVGVDFTIIASVVERALRGEMHKQKSYLFVTGALRNLKRKRREVGIYLYQVRVERKAKNIMDIAGGGLPGISTGSWTSSQVTFGVKKTRP